LEHPGSTAIRPYGYAWELRVSCRVLVAGWMTIPARNRQLPSFARRFSVLLVAAFGTGAVLVRGRKGKRQMKRTIALFLCMTLPIVCMGAESGGYKVDYDGGSVPGLKAGTNLKLFFRRKSG
jgi:hypothetical protein